MAAASAHNAFRRTMALMAAGNPLAAVLDAIVLTVEAEAPEILCSILLLDPSGKRLTLGAGPSLPDAYNAAIEGVVIGPNVGSCGTAAFENRPVIVADIDTLIRTKRTVRPSDAADRAWLESVRESRR